MSRGEPLTDEDRWGWLKALKEHAEVHPEKAGTKHLVITCSALKRQYRDLLRQGSGQAGDVQVHFLHLDAPEEVLRERAQARKGHFAGAALVHTQFEALEQPAADERDVVAVCVDQSVEGVQHEALAKVQRLIDAADC